MKAFQEKKKKDVKIWDVAVAIAVLDWGIHSGPFVKEHILQYRSPRASPSSSPRVSPSFPWSSPLAPPPAIPCGRDSPLERDGCLGDGAALEGAAQCLSSWAEGAGRLERAPRGPGDTVCGSVGRSSSWVGGTSATGEGAMSRYGPRCSGASRTVLSKAPRMLKVIGPEGEVFLEADLKISGRNCLDRPETTKEPKDRHYGKLQVLDPNEEVVIEPAEAMSRKVLLGSRRELTSKPYMATTKSSLSIAKISSEKPWSSTVSSELKFRVAHRVTEGYGDGHELSSKLEEGRPSDALSGPSVEDVWKKISSKSSENKDFFTNSDNKLCSSSFLREKTDSPAPSYSASMETTSQDGPRCDSSGDTGQDIEVAKNNEDSSQSPDDRLSETAEDDEEKQYIDEYVGENVAPLELMTEFLRAVMSRNYAVAKKLCQLILIYEPENPEAKEFSSLIEEKLLMEKSHAGEEESDDSSGDSEEDSSDDNDQSEDSSDESEDI
uniref:Glutamate-rich protein 2 n=1 Tax=Phascolarctos cinereus TaxID=38626 RepID=A0A6P5KLF9_PHACI|nr:glutamate-rich protein 2 [Phascolarctos cinereus]